MIKHPFLSLFLVALIAIGTARAYDTGHHADLTRNALQAMGYNNYAQDVCAVSNWLVDYFSYTLDVEDIPELAALHHDNLHTLQNVSNYLTVLSNNTRTAVYTAVQNNDPLTYLSIIGATLHAYQDFYTHSPWAELHQMRCGCYREDTWFSELAAVNGSITALLPTLQGLSTYSWGEACNPYERNCLPGQIPHGDYCEGINKDSYVRPWFESSYAFAFAGTIEWVYNIEQWARTALIGNGTALIQAAQSYVPPSQNDIEELHKDVEATITVSYATKTVFQDDGHWKGPGSGSVARFAAAGAEFIVRSSIYKKQFTENRFWQQLVSPNPYDVDPNDPQEYSQAVEYVVAWSQMPPALTNFTKIKVRTTQVTIPDNLFDTPSPYARITIDGQEFIENVQIDQTDFRPHWTSIKFIPANQQQVAIGYSLWNDEFPSDDEFIRIVNGGDGDGALNMTFNVASQQLSGADIATPGIFNTLEVPFSASADGNSVSLYVTKQEFGPQCRDLGGQLPTPFCPDEAYTQLRLHQRCSGRAGEIVE